MKKYNSHTFFHINDMQYIVFGHEIRLGAICLLSMDVPYNEKLIGVVKAKAAKPCNSLGKHITNC